MFESMVYVSNNLYLLVMYFVKVLSFAPTKKCSRCKGVFFTDNFYRNSSHKDGLASECKYCSQKKDKRVKSTASYRASRLASNHKRRVLVKRGMLLDTDYIDYLRRKSKGYCSYCSRKVGRDKLTIDHYVPVSKGGTNDNNNLVLCCQQCNSSKGNKDATSWLEEKGYRYTHKRE